MPVEDRSDVQGNAAVPNGYRASPVGPIPKGWELVPFSELFEFKNGVNAEKRAYGYGVLFANVLEVITNSHLRTTDIPGRVSLPKVLTELYRIRRGDVLFNRTSETQEEVGLASVYLDDDSAVFGGFVIRGRPKADSFDPIYAGYALRAPLVRAQIMAKGQGAIRANIGQGDLRQVHVLRPQIEEQRAIAAALSDVDGLISMLCKLIGKKRAIKAATMQQLLTGKTRLPGFKGDWDVKRIGEFTDCTAGGTPSTSVPGYWGGSNRWMSSGELNLKIVTEVEGRITDKGLYGSSAQMLPVSCVLIGLAGQGKTRGTVAINKVPLSTNQSIAAVYPDRSFCPEYLYYNLDTRYDELRSMSTGDGGRGGLNLKIIRAIAVPLPELKEQIAIASVLSDMDAEIAALERRRDKTKAIKQGMMRALLTGRIRLVKPEVSP